MSKKKAGKTLMKTIDEFYEGSADTLIKNLRDNGKSRQDILKYSDDMQSFGMGKGALYGAAGLGAVDLVFGNDWNPMQGIMMGAAAGAGGSYLSKKIGQKMPNALDRLGASKKSKKNNKLKSNGG